MPERELTPAEEERVRRLLAAARHDEALPDDVASRLDRVLLELHAGREADLGFAGASPVSGDETTDELAARRRRRRWGAGLLAAAAAVVVGAALPGLLPDSGEDAMSGDSAVSDESGADGGFSHEAPADDAREQSTDPALRRRIVAARDADPAGLPCARRPTWGAGRAVPLRYQGRDLVVVLRAPAAGSQRADVFSCNADDLRTWVVVPPP